MTVPGPGYAITARVEAPASATAAGDLAVAVGRVGGVMTAFDVVESRTDSIIVDISCNALSEEHAEQITDALDGLDGVRGAQRLRPHVPHAPRRQDRGHAEGRPAHP